MVENNDTNEGRKPQEFGPWREVLSSSGKIYFYNSETEVSQWDKPQEWREHEAQQEVQRLAALEAERQRQQAVSSQAMPQFPYPFPNMPVLPPNLPPPPGFPYAGPGLPFSIPGPPGFPPAPPPIPPPRVQLSQSQQRIPPNNTTGPSQKLSPSTPKHYSKWLTKQMHSNMPPPPPWLIGPQLISPPKLSFNPMQQQTQQPPHQQMQQQHVQQQQVHQQRLNLPRSMQNYGGSVGPLPPRYSGQEMVRPVQREDQKAPHPYAIPQALPPRDTPHPYRRDDTLRKSQENRPEIEASRKREAENIAADNDPKRPARVADEVAQDVAQAEPTEDNPSEEEEPFMKYIDSEAQLRADELKAELNLNVDQHAFNVRIDSYAANRKAQESNNKALASRTYDIILSHEIQLLDIQLKGIEERRQRVESSPLRPPVFDTPENRSKWIQSLLENMRERQKRNNDLQAELQRKLDESLIAIDEEMAEASAKLEEDRTIRREAANQRHQQTETERVKRYLEVANKMEDTAKKLNRKLEDGKRRNTSE